MRRSPRIIELPNAHCLLQTCNLLFEVCCAVRRNRVSDKNFLRNGILCFSNIRLLVKLIRIGSLVLLLEVIISYNTFSDIFKVVKIILIERRKCCKSFDSNYKICCKTLTVSKTHLYLVYIWSSFFQSFVTSPGEKSRRKFIEWLYCSLCVFCKVYFSDEKLWSFSTFILIQSRRKRKWS